jgi:integrase/recombinase XerD
VLHLYRRHRTSCPHRAEQYRRCSCPISVRGTLGNQFIRQGLDQTSWEAATAVIAAWTKAGQIRPPDVTQKPITDAVAAFLADAESRGLGTDTINKYRLLLERRLVPWCTANHYLTLPAITLDALTTFRATWVGGALAKSKTQERLKAFFRWCVARHWITDNPAVGLSSFRVKHEPTLPFTEEEVARILAACDQYSIQGVYGTVNRSRMRAMVLLLRWSGLRIRDAVTITRERVAAGMVDLYTQKTGQHVRVPIPPVAQEAFDALPVRTDRPDLLFWSGNGLAKSAVANWQRSLRELFKLAKVDQAHAHRFRDTFAVQLLLEGVELADVSILLGHSSIKITERHYAPWVRARQQRLEAVVRKTWTPISRRPDDPQPAPTIALSRLFPLVPVPVPVSTSAEGSCLDTPVRPPMPESAASGGYGLRLVRGGKGA